VRIIPQNRVPMSGVLKSLKVPLLAADTQSSQTATVSEIREGVALTQKSVWDRDMPPTQEMEAQG
jgi:hypothetical protein